ncbi:MAG: hypothetical protein ACTS81_00155, partial [Arsenophonus sp. ER-BJ3-MAG3]
ASIFVIFLFPSDAYQSEQAVRFGVCQKEIWQTLKKLSITYKKAFSHPKADGNLQETFRQKVEACSLAYLFCYSLFVLTFLL